MNNLEVKMAVSKKTEELNISIPEVSVKEEKKETVKKVPVKTKEAVKVFYGDRWYFFNSEEEVMVIPEIKEYLKRQNALAVL